MSEDEKVPDAESKAVSLYEANLQRDIQEIELEIRRLLDSKTTLQRLLMESKGRDKSKPIVKRRNSVNRVMIETAIHEALKGKSFVRSGEIYDQVKKVSHDLKHTTFRSYLHRMKERGLIQQHGRGAWSLA